MNWIQIELMASRKYKSVFLRFVFELRLHDKSEHDNIIGVYFKNCDV